MPHPSSPIAMTSHHSIPRSIPNLVIKVHHIFHNSPRSSRDNYNYTDNDNDDTHLPPYTPCQYPEAPPTSSASTSISPSCYTSSPNSYINTTTTTRSLPHNSNSVYPTTPILYARLTHDFTAECADELTALAGDNLAILARSTPDWFVAQPVDRPGELGLIPVDWVEVWDWVKGRKVDNIRGEAARRGILDVREWKGVVEMNMREGRKGVTGEGGRSGDF
ncbi:bud emergence protein 1 [Varicellaria rhodocarpa]|nr:bud emergence protein 1 [Varicellaria rhodocarpa]